MNAAELTAALNTVEQDHRLVLDKIQALKDAVCRLLEPEVDVAQVIDQHREIHAYLATQFEAHMEEEETTLFPLLERQGSEDSGLVVRLRQQHAEIRRRREEFGNCLRVAGDLEGGSLRWCSGTCFSTDGTFGSSSTTTPTLRPEQSTSASPGMRRLPPRRALRSWDYLRAVCLGGQSSLESVCDAPMTIFHNPLLHDQLIDCITPARAHRGSRPSPPRVGLNIA
jgi:hypothetical protein